MHGREFIEKEADSYEGAQESLRISGVVTVPVVIIKDKIIRGYNIREISEALGLSTARAWLRLAIC